MPIFPVYQSIKVSIESYIYHKRQTADSSWEFLKVDNKHIKQSKAIIIDEYNVKLLNILKK